MYSNHLIRVSITTDTISTTEKHFRMCCDQWLVEYVWRAHSYV